MRREETEAARVEVIIIYVEEEKKDKKEMVGCDKK